MKKRVVFLTLVAALLAGCGIGIAGKPVAYTAVPGRVTVTEYDNADKVIGTYFVEATTLKRDLGTGTLSGPGLPHPLKNYSVDR